jgi:hypothetical protein
VLIRFVIELLLFGKYFALEPIGAEDCEVDIAPRNGHADQVNQFVLGLRVDSDLHVEDEGSDGEDQQRALKGLPGETGEEEVEVQRTGKPTEEVVLVQPILRDEDQGEDAHPGGPSQHRRSRLNHHNR